MWNNCLEEHEPTVSSSYNECLKECKSYPDEGCTEFTFLPKSFRKEACLTFKDCASFNNETFVCDNCLSGKVSCRETENFCCKGTEVETLFDVNLETCLQHCENNDKCR